MSSTRTRRRFSRPLPGLVSLLAYADPALACWATITRPPEADSDGLKARALPPRLIRNSLVVDEVHQPAGNDYGTDKKNEAVDSITKHRFRSGTLRDAKDNRRKAGEKNDCGKVRWGERHGFLPTAMLCASTAAIRFSNPATTMNFAP